MARGRTQNETTVNGTILQNSFHSAVQCEFILLKIFFYSEQDSYQNFSKKQLAIIKKQVLLNSAGRETFDIALASNNS